MHFAKTQNNMSGECWSSPRQHNDMKYLHQNEIKWTKHVSKKKKIINNIILIKCY